MNRGPFAEFTTHLAAVAEQWPLRHPEIAGTSSNRYERLSPIIMREVASAATKAGKPLPDKLLNHNAQHGLNVISRYLAHSATAAAQRNVDATALATILHDERSFEPLAAIASTQNKLAHRTEVDYGLGTALGAFDPYTVARYGIVDGAIVLDNLSATQTVHRLNMEYEGKELYDAKCAAHKSDSLHKIYHSMTAICLRDESLFALTLAN